MKFGRRGRGRSIGRREASKANKNNTNIHVPQQGSVAPKMEELSPISDERCQEILAHLSHFSEQLAKHDSTSWSDACMDDLIACMEIAIKEGWGELAQVLADTGRVLQTYENEQRCSEVIPFLQNAYDALCRLVGDIVIEKPIAESLAYWENIFSQAQDELSTKGMDLFQDATPTEETVDEEATESANTLPMLDELPPLESLVSFDDFVNSEKPDSVDPIPESTADAEEAPEQDNNNDNVIAFDAFDKSNEAFEETPEVEAEAIIEEETLETESEVVEEQEETPAVEQFDPPRIVVDIIDRICDVLGSLERDTGHARIASLSVMTGGLEALEHEAKLMKSATAQEACLTMSKACLLVSGGDEVWSDGLVEQGFAFCSVFIEALTNPESENIVAWEDECKDWMNALLTELKPAQEEVSAQEEAPVQEEAPAQEVPSEEPVIEAEEQVPEVSVVEETLAEPEVDTAIDETQRDTTQTEDAEPDYAKRSRLLLQSAQEAALKGNAEDVKTFALRAAAEMAKSEVYKAEEQLRESEIKLSQGIQNTEDSRESVKACEVTVKESTNLVSESQQMHNDASTATADIAKQLEDLEAGVAKLNTKIQNLQTRRDEEQEKVSQTLQEMDSTRLSEQQALTEYEELKVLEDDSRQRLEEARQHVKDRQRMVQVIESEMETARETMTREKGSLNDITQTIQQLSGIVPGEDEENKNELLF